MARTASDLIIRVEYGQVNVNPIFYSVQLFNYQTGLYEVLEFGILSETTDTVVEVDGIPGAEDYVNGVGEIRVRVAGTAREPQTPGGFTKLIDHVSVFVQE